ncbi:glycosyltransferase [Leptolyngbya sp. FACHB-261]|uniref:glycosyltransferase n=1 Tax=Leptolyngbya sp. FACHB-261 TaxID=2692806 RepID=UPI0016864F54|nr:hypothetical protein [Leptolyngbya sp. FACHB-261]MBD2100474.1 hypothetical protein [Leptolyngbya sp. FACHB-261]
MNRRLPPVYFYIPKSDWPNNFPENANVYWRGFSWGVFCWTLQTYLRLRELDFPCELVGMMPSEGIVLAHRDSLPYQLRPRPKLLLVCLKADREAHPFAQLHLVQNPKEASNSRFSNSRHYMPHWPQPGLIPRDSGRSERFENIAYLGHEANLAPELQTPAWREQLTALGLHWSIVEREHWHDYSQVDAVVAVRRLGHQGDSQHWKPPSKLLNAWHAGVPAILGYESAFQAERKSELDYLEVGSVDDILAALQRLRNQPDLRRAMIDNGRCRAEETQAARLATQWQRFITEVAVPTYNRWSTASHWSQQSFLKRRILTTKVSGMQHRIQSLVLPKRA